jgi:hypothetical protein
MVDESGFWDVMLFSLVRSIDISVHHVAFLFIKSPRKINGPILDCLRGKVNTTDMNHVGSRSCHDTL